MLAVIVFAPVVGLSREQLSGSRLRREERRQVTGYIALIGAVLFSPTVRADPFDVLLSEHQPEQRSLQRL